VVGLLERHPRNPAVGVRSQGQGQAEQEGGIRQHVDHCRPGRQGPQLDPQVPTAGRVVDGPVPAPHRALMQPQLLQGRHPVAVQPLQGSFVAEHGQDRLMQPHALLKQLQGAGPGPAGPERDPRHPPAGPAHGVAVVDRLLEQRHPRLLPEPMAEEGGGVAGHGQGRSGGELGGVEVVGEAVGIDPQVDLEGGVGPLEADVVGHQLQRVSPVDADPERLVTQPPQAVVEGPVAGRVRQRRQPEISNAQGREDPHHDHPAFVPGGGSAHEPQSLIELTAQRRERAAGQRRRGQVQLEVEPVDLQHHPGVGRLGSDRLVAGQRAALPVDQEQLQLRADRGRTHPEPRPPQQAAQGHQALVKAPPEPPVVHRVEPLTIDGKAHGGADASAATTGHPRAERPVDGVPVGPRERPGDRLGCQNDDKRRHR
jgi:hypothetical protein